MANPNLTATIFDIQKASYVDGPGIRTTVFFKGCNLRCRWCHNPESQKTEPQMLFYRDRCVACGKCGAVCPQKGATCTLCGRCALLCPQDAREVCGKLYTVDEVFEEIGKDKTFYESSGGGVTFSGGECMLQIDFLTELLRRCQEADIHTAVDTAGHVPWERFAQVLPYTNLFLYDIKCISEERHIQGTGVPNGRILDNLRRLSSAYDGEIHIRIPIVPDFNDDEAELERIAAFLQEIRHSKVELLPYHRMGIHKYVALGLTPTEFTVPTDEAMKQYGKILY